MSQLVLATHVVHLCALRVVHHVEVLAQLNLAVKIHVLFVVMMEVTPILAGINRGLEFNASFSIKLKEVVS